MGNFNLKDRTQAKWSMQKFAVSPATKKAVRKHLVKILVPKQDITAMDLSRVVKDIEAAAQAALALFSKPLSSRTPTYLVEN